MVEVANALMIVLPGMFCQQTKGKKVYLTRNQASTEALILNIENKMCFQYGNSDLPVNSDISGTFSGLSLQKQYDIIRDIEEKVASNYYTND